MSMPSVPTLSVRQALAEAAPGSLTRGRMAVGTLASGAPIAIPFLALKGGSAGPTLWINGQVHGTELNGIVAAMKFVRALDPARVAGNVVVTSTANPLALDARARHAPQDGNDLDQCFPGRADGFTTERLAAALFGQIDDDVALVICMHTQGVQAITRSYTVYKQHPNGRVSEAALLPFMAAFEPVMACRMGITPGIGELLGHIAGALDYQLIARGIPSFMVELGSGQRVDPVEVERAVGGFHDVAVRLGLVDGRPRAYTTLMRSTRRGHASVDHGGLFLPAAKPGDRVPAGQPYGEVVDLFGEVIERPSLAEDAIVIAIRVDPVVHTGDRYGHLAYAWDVVPVHG